MTRIYLLFCLVVIYQTVLYTRNFDVMSDNLKINFSLSGELVYRRKQLFLLALFLKTCKCRAVVGFLFLFKLAFAAISAVADKVLQNRTRNNLKLLWVFHLSSWRDNKNNVYEEILVFMHPGKPLR